MNAWLSARGIEARGGNGSAWLQFRVVVVERTTVTPEFEGSLKTELVNCTLCNVDIVTAARLGVTVTPSTPCTTVIVAVPVFVLSVTEVAVSVTVGGLGMLVGPV